MPGKCNVDVEGWCRSTRARACSHSHSHALGAHVQELWEVAVHAVADTLPAIGPGGHAHQRRLAGGVHRDLLPVAFCQQRECAVVRVLLSFCSWLSSSSGSAPLCTLPAAVRQRRKRWPLTSGLRGCLFGVELMGVHRVAPLCLRLCARGATSGVLVAWLCMGAVLMCMRLNVRSSCFVLCSLFRPRVRSKSPQILGNWPVSGANEFMCAHVIEA